MRHNNYAIQIASGHLHSECKTVDLISTQASNSQKKNYQIFVRMYAYYNIKVIEHL